MGRHPLLIIFLTAILIGASAPRGADAWDVLPQEWIRPGETIGYHLNFTVVKSATPAKQIRSGAREKSAMTPVLSSYEDQEIWGFFSGGILSRFFRSQMYGYPIRQGNENWPFGFLDMVALGVILFIGYRALRPVRVEMSPPPPPRFQLPPKVLPIPYSIKPEAEEILNLLSASDPPFDLVSFLEFAHQMAYDMHEAWNRQELEEIQDRITNLLMIYLKMGLRFLALRNEISRVEDLTLSEMVVTRAWQEPERDMITVWFQGKALDYILEKTSFKLQSGSMTYPADLSECWIFERPKGREEWLLNGIEEA